MGKGDLTEHFKAIQKGLQRSGRVMVLSGTQALVRGIIILAGVAASLPLLGMAWTYMLYLWLGVTAIAIGAETVMFFRMKAKHVDKYVSGIERQILRTIVLVIIAGASISAALYLKEGASSLIPGIWLILVGVIYIVCGLFSFSNTWILGLGALLGGCVSLFLEPLYFFLILGATLGLGSIIYAIVVKHGEGKSDGADI